MSHKQQTNNSSCVSNCPLSDKEHKIFEEYENQIEHFKKTGTIRRMYRLVGDTTTFLKNPIHEFWWWNGQSWVVLGKQSGDSVSHD